MKGIRSILIAAALTGSASFLGAQSPQEILARVDAQRQVQDFSFIMQMTSWDGASQVDAETLWGFVQGAGSENKSLVAFADPASVRGRKLLMDGSIVYLLFPRTTNPIRLTPLQILMGQASNGDVVRTGFSQDYDISAVAEETKDGVSCYLFTLALKPSRKDVSYRDVRLWVAKETLFPVRAEFSAGATLLKVATYSDYRPALGKYLPFTVDISDGQDLQKHTVMTYLKVGQKKVADTMFRRDYLASWTPEVPR